MGDWSVKQKLREEILKDVETGNLARVKKLLNDGADVDESVGAYLSGKTLLVLAIEKCHVDMAQLLIDRGANLKTKVNNNNMDLETFAREKELTALADYIARKIELNMHLQDEVSTGDADAVRKSLDEGANVNVTITVPNQPDMNLLFLALTEGHLEVAKILLEHNININSSIKWENGAEDTAQSFAERTNQPQEILRLIKEKVDHPGGDDETKDDETKNDETKDDAGDDKNRTIEVNTIENESTVATQKVSINEFIMADVDVDKEFMNEAELNNVTSQQMLQPIRPDKTKCNKSSSCTIT